MSKTILLLVTLLVLPCAFAQSPPQAPLLGAAPQSLPALTKFSLDFPGGAPKQLVAAIEKAMAKPVNAIIPPEHADVKLPPLKMNNVDVQQLFAALERASAKVETYTASASGGIRPSSYQQMTTSYGFRTQGQLSDESVWYFYVEKPTLPPVQPYTAPRICRYFSLAPYLDRGQTVDDITTAIQTGWKMLGDDDTPKISFHKETKLLIAVGEPGKLEIIDNVLTALKPTLTLAPPPTFVDPATGLPMSPPVQRLPQRALKAAPNETKPPGDSKP